MERLSIQLKGTDGREDTPRVRGLGLGDISHHISISRGTQLEFERKGTAAVGRLIIDSRGNASGNTDQEIWRSCSAYKALASLARGRRLYTYQLTHG